MSKAPQIKNRAPAAIQITAEQLLREAQERGIEEAPKAPKQFVTDKEELVQYQQTKRKDFEDQLRRQRQNIGIWCRYALWEASQLDFTRARSVFERSLDVDYRNQTLWLKYAEMEMKNKFINHARNVWDRAVTLLPRVDSFWYKYTYMEEMVGAIDNARQIFERWMAWEPDDLAWAAYIKFEMRQGNVESARQLYERYIALWPTARAYLKYARWEEGNHQRGYARKIYERSLAELHPQEKSEKLLLNFARFEERCKEVDRARTIYQYAIEQRQQQSATDADIAELKQEFLLFEKRHGKKQDIENVILQQRRELFEQKLLLDKYDYDVWMDYIHLEESEGNASATIRAVYDRAVAQVPPLAEKKYWKRYIYLWINYAIYEELTNKDVHATRDVYQRCLKVIPHKVFTFGKIWLMAAHFEVRQHQLPAARKLLGQAIGLCGKDNLFRGYIDLELQLGEIDRCRTLYGKYVAYAPYATSAWQKFAALEASVGENVRARAIYELAVSQVELDTPELIWKAYIDWEIAEREVSRARALYERLLEKSQHVKVWISYGMFEVEQGLLLIGESSSGNEKKEGEEDNEEEGDFVILARSVFSRGYEALRKEGLKEERVLLLEAWREMEQDVLRHFIEVQGRDRDTSTTAAETKIETQRMYLSMVEKKFPRKVKRVLTAEEIMDLREQQQTQAIEEEFYDYIFPDDEKKPMGMAFLEKALAWKQQLAANNNSNNSNNGDKNDDKEEESLLGKRGREVEDEDKNAIDLDL